MAERTAHGTILPVPPPPPKLAPPTNRRRRRRVAWGRLVVAALLAAGLTGVVYRYTRPGPRVLAAPKVTPELEAMLLGAIAPGWPARKPPLPTSAGPISAVAGRIDALAVLDADGDERREWGVCYTWMGPEDALGARVMIPGFAVVKSPWRGAPAELAFDAPAAGGWQGNDEDRKHGFEAATEASAQIEAVRFSRREVGFVASHHVETSIGGRMGRGISRAFLPMNGGWTEVWQDVTSTRLRHDRTDEVTMDRRVEVLDLDGNGNAEIVVTPSWYHRHLLKGDRGVHFTAEGPGRQVWRREGRGFTLAALDGTGPGPRPRLRPSEPLYAVRAPKPPAIDGKFGDWDAVELSELGVLMLDEPAQLRYQKTERGGTHDFSGAVRFMWDPQALYVRADVMDDTLKVAPAGKQLFEGDHLGLWLDMDLARDFNLVRRDADDYQLGLAPGARATGGEVWSWVPRPGRGAAKIASAPLLDPYEGAVRGWRLEAAIPWTDLGGAPRLTPGPAPDLADARQELAPRRYQLKLAGMLGIGVVLTDADESAQELAYVSSPSFGWGAPKTWNTLLLVEGQRIP